MENATITHVSPNKLTVHPFIAKLPEWSDRDPQFSALVEDIRDRGIDCPIHVDDENRIVDGRHRWRAASRLKLKSVPVIVREKSEAARIAVHSLVQRRHLPKGQIAYIAYPLFAPAHEELRAAHTAWLQSGAKGTHPTPAKTVEDMAGEIGVSRELFKQAAKLHDIFAESEAVRAEWEPKILNEVDPVSLGAAIAGIGGQKKTAGQAKQPVGTKLNLFRDAFRAVNTRIRYWDKFDTETREEALKSVRKTVETMPADLRSEIGRVIRAAEKAERTAALEAQK